VPHDQAIYIDYIAPQTSSWIKRKEHGDGRGQERNGKATEDKISYRMN